MAARSARNSPISTTLTFCVALCTSTPVVSPTSNGQARRTSECCDLRRRHERRPGTDAALELAIDEFGVLTGVMGLVKGTRERDDGDDQQQRIRTREGGHPHPPDKLREGLGVGTIPAQRRRDDPDDAAEELGGIVAVDVVEPALRDTELRRQVTGHPFVGRLVPVRERESLGRGHVPEEALEEPHRLLDDGVVG